MRVAARLYLAILPAALGVLLVAGLAYWGQYQRTVPGLVVLVGAVAVVGSFVAAWTNTRYVARRVERLAHGAVAPGDELETIERVVDSLASEVTVARSASETRVAEYAELLAATSAEVVQRLDEVRLPLHILLENSFGALNENQEEMLAAARAAAEAADVALRQLRAIAEIDQGALTLRRDPVRIGDVLRGLVPTLRARAEGQANTLELDMEPALPTVRGDPARLRDALRLVVEQRIDRTPPGSGVRIVVGRSGGGIAVAIDHGTLAATGADEAVATRLVLAHGGRIETSGGRTVVWVG